MSILVPEGRASARPAFAARLAASEARWRVVSLTLLPAALLALALVEPTAPPKWFPFATSCGAITGLPCIFCGMTRALHHLLHGEFGRALYFNWLSYPILAGAFALLSLQCRRALPRPQPSRPPAASATHAGTLGRPRRRLRSPLVPAGLPCRLAAQDRAA